MFVWPMVIYILTVIHTWLVFAIEAIVTACTCKIQWLGTPALIAKGVARVYMHC